MTVTVSKIDAARMTPEKSGVVASTRSLDLSRENRWKKRNRGGWTKLLTLAVMSLFIGFLAAAVFSPKAKTAVQGGGDSFAVAVSEAFPEADPSNILTTHDGDLPRSATLHLPAHLIEPGQGIGNPFARLGVEFGGIERTLSGVEMAARLENIGNAILPADMLRCHSYEVGEISSKVEDRHRTRILHLHLNPGC